MKKIGIYILVCMMAFSATSCLDKYPENAIAADDAITSIDEADQAVIGIYSSFLSGALYSGYLTLCPDIQADFVYAVQGNTNQFGTHWLWDIRSTNSEVESVYAALYRVIGRCNFYLDQVEELRNSLTDDAEIQYLDYYTGEVYCARANAYAELIKCFCEAYDPATAENELGVVLADTYFGKNPAKRASLYDSYQFVISDLEKAEDLHEPEYDYYDAPYFTHAAAHAIHARVALYMQDWDKAIEYSTKLIDNKAFSLSSARDVYTGGQTFFQYMWNYDLATEIIWRVRLTPQSPGAAIGSAFLNFTTDYAYFYPDYVPAQWVLNLYASNDYRYDAYFYQAQTGYAHGLVWPLLVKYYGNGDFINSYQLYHVSMPKPFRLAEQYLIRAEAYCRKGQYSSGAADIATLRQARCTGNASASMNAGNWLQTISDERVKELYMEGFRLHDLKRWGKGFERTPQSQTQSEGSSLKIEAGDPLFVWPIPNHEIVSPGSQIQPNESNR